MAKEYLVFEISQFSSHYFSVDVPSMHTRRRCNEDDNDEFTLPVAFQEEHVSRATPVNDTIPVTLLSQEKDIEVVNEEGATEEGAEAERDDDYEYIEDEVVVDHEDSDEDNEIVDDD